MTEAAVTLSKNAAAKHANGRNSNEPLLSVWLHNLLCHRIASAKWYYHILSRRSCELCQYQGVRLTAYERKALSHFR